VLIDGGITGCVCIMYVVYSAVNVHSSLGSTLLCSLTHSLTRYARSFVRQLTSATPPLAASPVKSYGGDGRVVFCGVEHPLQFIERSSAVGGRYPPPPPNLRVAESALLTKQYSK
jgi:hypothetical protein